MASLFILMASVVVADAILTTDFNCPERCQCSPSPEHHERLITKCSHRTLQEIPHNTDPSTIHLDLSGNEIQVIPRGVFDQLPYLNTLLLNNNQIRTIEAHAFRDMNNIRRLDLSRNKITHLASHTLSRIKGSPDCSPENPCYINLQENPLAVVDSYALSWCKRLSLIFGNSSTDLVIKAYAFYGTENVTEIMISDVPSLYLEHRIFTNTDQVKRLEISNTELKTIEKFTFEGLTNVEEIHFHRIRFNKIKEFGFSGIFYLPSEISQEITSYSGANQRAGGLFNISLSVIPMLPPDGFRDTNLRTLIFVDNHIDLIKGWAFRGLHSLFCLALTANAIGTIEPYAFGSLKNVPRIWINENNLSHLVERAFADSKGIHKLSLHAKRNSNISLGSYSFSGLRDIDILDIKGAPGSRFVVQKDAFHDLGGVNTLQIAHVSLPTLAEHTFRGLNKVQILKLQYCNISHIDGLAFGGTPGAVAAIELSEGNRLSCDCDTSKLLRDFQSKFSRFTVTCVADNSVIRVLREDSSDWPTCDTGISTHAHHSSWLSVVLLIFLILSLL